MAKQTPNILMSDHITIVTNLVSRIDERVKILGENQESIESNIKYIESKVQEIELKLENTKIRLGNHDVRWSGIFDFFWKIAIMILARYILYILGIQSPP